MKPTIEQVRTMRLSELPGKLETGATARVQYKVVEVDDDYSNEVIAVSYGDNEKELTIIPSRDSGRFNRFIHTGI